MARDSNRFAIGSAGKVSRTGSHRNDLPSFRLATRRCHTEEVRCPISSSALGARRERMH